MDPPPIASNRPLKLANGVLFLVLSVQLWGVVRAVRKLSYAHESLTVFAVSMLILTILFSMSWGLLIALDIPHLFGMTLMATVVRVPDFGYVFLLSAFLAFSTSILRGWAGLRFVLANLFWTTFLRPQDRNR
jgi:hypothetical protein